MVLGTFDFCHIMKLELSDKATTMAATSKQPLCGEYERLVTDKGSMKRNDNKTRKEALNIVSFYGSDNNNINTNSIH